MDLQGLMDALKGLTIADLVALLTPKPAPPPKPPTMGGFAIQIDPIVGPGTPGTRTMPTTAHVLSDPKPTLENIVGYFERTSLQTGANLAASGAFMFNAGHVWPDHAGSDPNDWPEIVDRFANPVAYMTADQRANQANIAAQWAAHDAAIQQHATTPAASEQQQRVEANQALNEGAGPVPISVATVGL